MPAGAQAIKKSLALSAVMRLHHGCCDIACAQRRRGRCAGAESRTKSDRAQRGSCRTQGFGSSATGPARLLESGCCAQRPARGHCRGRSRRCAGGGSLVAAGHDGKRSARWLLRVQLQCADWPRQSAATLRCQQQQLQPEPGGSRDRAPAGSRARSAAGAAPGFSIRPGDVHLAGQCGQ